MKPYLLIILFFMVGCKLQSDKNHPDPVSDTTTVRNSPKLKNYGGHIDSSLFIMADTIRIASPNYDTLVYSRKEFNDIITYFPGLYSDFPINPDQSYYPSESYNILKNDSLGEMKHLKFSSETGQDIYYVLYGYFLKKKNSDRKYNIRRNTLVEIYNAVNEIYRNLNYGGTYFIHQSRRITGYAEYSIYKYDNGEQYYNKGYHIAAQKDAFIKLLQQKISDEISVDQELNNEQDRAVRKKQLFAEVDKIDALITDNFYLLETQEFLYSHYK